MKKLFTFLLTAILVFCISVHSYAQIITTIAGSDSLGLGDGGPATIAQLNGPIGLAIDAVGNIYIGDRDDNRIRKVTPAGYISTVAGSGLPGFTGDNGPATDARIYRPYGVAVDHLGNIYFAEGDSNRIRKVDAAGIITTIAGTGVAGFNGDNIPATSAQINGPSGVAVDNAGNIFIGDYHNNRVRKINLSGIITTFAGNGTGAFDGDNGPATAASLFHPYGINFDNLGNLYIADYTNVRVRRVNTSSIIQTIAGNGTVGLTGDNGPATAAALGTVTSAVADGMGNVYIADALNNVIRKINTEGIITRAAGTGVDGYNGDNQPATQAKLFKPVALAVDGSGNLYISDFGNNRIRYIQSTVFVNNLIDIQQEIYVYPNPNNGSFTMNIASAIDEPASVIITNISGNVISEISTTTNRLLKLKLDERSGLYLITITTVHGTKNVRLILKN